MYAPTATIGSIIYVGGASDFSGGLVIDTTNSFSFNPAANTIGSIAAIPRATGETRALTFNGKMLVMGGGRVAPNPSNEVDAYDPATNTWTVNTPVPAFVTARRNFPTDTDGTCRIWLAGGYDGTGVRQRRWKSSAAAEEHRRHQQPYGNTQRRRPARQAVRPGHGAPLRHTR